MNQFVYKKGAILCKLGRSNLLILKNRVCILIEIANRQKGAVWKYWYPENVYNFAKISQENTRIK